MEETLRLEAEADVLEERRRGLTARKAVALGALVMALKADALELEVLAGALLEALQTTSEEELSRLRRRGASFFRRERRRRAEAEKNPGRPKGRNDPRGRRRTACGAPASASP